MELTFNPALIQQTTIPVPDNGAVQVRFTATFASRAAYEDARDRNVHVEMWTDLPTAGGQSGWHALRFEYPEEPSPIIETSEGGKVVSLLPPTAQSPDRVINRAVHLDLVLRDARSGSKYSFTYRIVRPSGAVQWLGSFGRNGEIVFTERDERLKWADQWKLQGDAATKVAVDASRVDELATLSSEIEWTCWAFGECGWPALSNIHAVPPSQAILLLPHKPFPPLSVTVPQTLVLSVHAGATLTIHEGRVEVQNARSVAVHTVDNKNATDVLNKVLPRNSQVVELKNDVGCVVIATSSVQDGAFPIALSFVPVMPQETSCLELTIHSKTLHAILPSAQASDIVLVDTIAQAFCFVGSNASEGVAVKVDRSGGQLLLSPLHALAGTESPAWKLAMLSPTASALVEVLTHTEGTSPALPTPPPSPPPAGVSPMRPVSGRSTPTPHAISVPPFQSFQSLAESTKLPLEPVVPMTPTSPETTMTKPLRNEAPEEEVEPVAEVEERPPTLTVAARPSPVNDGLLRFFFTWFIRAVLARVWGLVDTSARWIGFASFTAGDISFAEEREPIHPVEVAADVVASDDEADGATHTDELQDITFITAREDSNAGDDASAVCSDEPANAIDENNVDDGDNGPIAVTPRRPEPIAYTPSVLGAQPAVHTSSKPRFLADVRSNIVSLLVHAPHTHAKPSDLSISINEKRVHDGDGYSCEQLSGNVYLLGIYGPEGGSKVEVALD